MIYSTVDCPFRYIFSKAGRVRARALDRRFRCAARKRSDEGD